MHRDANKWRQHVASSCSPTFPFSPSLFLSLSIIISLSYLGLSLPLSLIIPHSHVSLPHFLMLIRVLFLCECCRPKDFAESAAARLLRPCDDSDNLASYEERWRQNPTQLASPWAAPSVQPDNIRSPTGRQPSLPVLSVLPISFACSLLK